MKANKLTGMPVISIADGIKAGQVVDLRIMATSPQVQALILKAGRAHTVLPFEAIHTIGPDAIMIDGLDDVRADDEFVGGEVVRHFTSLVGSATAGDDGSYLGDIKDLEVDPISGRVDAILLHRGGVMGIGGEDVSVPGTHLHAFGPKLLTVAPPVTDTNRSSALPDTEFSQQSERTSVQRS